MKKKILVTGGAGFIGFNFVNKLLELGYEIHNIDVLRYSANKKEIFKIKNSKHFFYKINVNNKDIYNILKKNKILEIIHFAAETHVDNSIGSPKFFFKNNCLDFIDFVENISKYYNELSNIRKKKFKFIYISTDEIYGSLKLKEKSFNESSPLKPKNPYSSSKASAELYLSSYANTFNFPYIITNCSNNFGKFQNEEKFIPTIFKNALKGKKIPIYGDGKNIRDWIYVDDHINAILLLLKKGKINNKYNIGSNQEFKNIELANIICDILDDHIPKKISYKNQIVFIKDRLGHDFRYSIDNKKIKKIGWKPQISLRDGLLKIADFYIKKFK